MTRHTSLRSLLATLSLVLAACGGDAAPASPPPPAGITPEIAATLAAADRKDGSEDKVVHRCASCMLNMDGTKELALAVGGYELHFCKPGCLARYQKDALGELARLRVR